MSIPLSRFRSQAFALVGLLLIAVVGFGFYRSLRPDRRPAPLSLAEAVVAYRREIEGLLRARSFEQAEAQLRSAKELRDTAPQIYHDLLGQALLGQPGRSLDAEAQFHEALRHDPGYESARRNLARLQAGTQGPVAPPGSGAGPAGGEGLDLSRGRLYVRQFQNGELEQLHRSFSPDLAEQMSVEVLRRMQEVVSSSLGEETELLAETIVPGPNFRIYTRTARFENQSGEIDIEIQLTDNREIAGLEFRPGRRALR